MNDSVRHVLVVLWIGLLIVAHSNCLAQEPAVPESYTVTVSGRVTASDTGEPIPGARVEVLETPENKGGLPLPTVGESIETNPDGSYSVEIQTVRGAPVGVRAVAEGREGRTAFWSWESTTRKRVAHFALQMEGSLKGRLLEGNDRPIPDAVVFVGTILDSRPEHAGAPAKGTLEHTITGSDGTFDLKRLRAGANHTVYIEVSGYLPVEFQGLRDGQSDVELSVLRPSGSIHGKVLHEDTTPAPGVSVSISGRLSATDKKILTPLNRKTSLKTGEDGAYSFEELPDGSYVITASVGGIRKQETIEIGQAAPNATVQFGFPAPRTIRGRAIDAGTKAPVRGLSVYTSFRNLWHPEANVAEAVTGADGRFTVRGYPRENGSFNISIAPPEGWWFRENAANGRPMQLLRVINDPAKDVLDAEVLLERVSPLRVRVRDIHGEIATDAELHVGQDINTREDTRTVKNRFLVRGEEFYDVPAIPGAKVWIRALNERGVADLVVDPATPETPHTEMEIQIQPWASLAGTALHDAAAVPKVPVRIVETTPFGSYEDAAPMAETDAQGDFYFPKVPPGRFRITLPTDIPKLGYYAEQELIVELKPGEHIQKQELLVRPGRRIEFLLKDEKGAPLAGESFLAGIGYGPNARLVTDASGWAVLQGADPSARFVSFIPDPQRHGFGMPLEFEITEEPIEVVLKASRSGTLQLKVTQSGTPQERFVYRVSGMGTYTSTDGSRVYTGGVLTLNDLHAGIYRGEVIGVSERGTLTRHFARFEIEIPKDGEMREVEVSLSAGRGSLRGVVTDSRGRSVEGATVSLTPSNVAPLNVFPVEPTSPFFPYAAKQETTSAADGSFLFSDKPAGPYELRAETTGLAGTTQQVVVPESQTEAVNLSLGSPFSVFGKIVAPDGSPIEGIELTFASHRVLLSTVTDAHGAYRFEVADEGYHDLRFSIPELMVEESRPVEFALDRREIELNFDYTGFIRLSGKVVTSNATAAFATTGFRLQSGEQYYTPELPLDSQDSFVTYVPPGKITAYLAVGSRHSSVPVGTFILPDQPGEQERDILVGLAGGNVVVVYPSDDAFVPGKVWQMYSKSANLMNRHEMFIDTRAAAPFQDQPSGTYDFIFTSRDRMWTGETRSELIPGNDNMVIIEVVPVQKSRRIGEMKGHLGRSNRLEVTPYLSPGTQIAFTLVLEAGAEALFSRVEIITEAGISVVSLTQTAISGTHEINNTFRVDLPDSLPEGPLYLVIYGNVPGSAKLGAKTAVYLEE